MECHEAHSYTINGIKVQFPCKAYPSQLSMMDKIIKGLERGQNCLLESPTGSGKSLALLCSALAWQSHEREKLVKDERNKNDACCSCKTKSGHSDAPEDQSSLPRMINQLSPSAMLQTSGRTEIPISDIEDDDFKVETKRIHGLYTSKKTAIGQMEINTPSKLASANDDPPCCCNCDNETSSNNRKRVPKIYFGTRTHKQIAQITKEMGRTTYRHTRMTILGSREHTCIDPEVSRLPNKNEECKNKLDGPGCRLFDRVRKISHRNLTDNGLDSAWDLDEFIGLCRKQKACPYFGTRLLKEGADVIFCPYNYLIDPLIRENMEINLKGQIVILDEAHNIEDSSRDAASFSITQTKLKEAMSDIQRLINESIKPDEHRKLCHMLNSFNEFIVSNQESLDGDYDRASRVWSGMDIVATLTHTGVGPEHFLRLKECFQAVVQDEEEKREANQGIKLKAATLQCLSGLFMVLGYIYRHDMKYLDDYKIAIVRSMEYDCPSHTTTENGWIQRRKRASKQLTLCYALHFWCLNPAVAFSDINDGVRSVVLTSGTLSPMDTFQSELAAPFPIQLEANHVISNAQIWVGTIAKGPRGTSLLGSYQNSETYAYQDDVGEVILGVCQTIPHGVLCFLPSYKSMEKLTSRWKNTGLWQKLMQCKSVMLEPRAGDKVDFDILIKEYYDLISAQQVPDTNTVNGALFLAVCRGKVSEGIDFADNNARAVITVGIPFPNIKDTQIELKKQYNDQRSASRGLLRGREWYEIQAYRAINQALGRCIRHRNDWGALILVDERYGKNPQRYTKGLSKWIRKRVQYYGTFQQAENSLKTFTKRRLENTNLSNASGMVSMDSPSYNSLPAEILEMTAQPLTPCTDLDNSACNGPAPSAITNYFTSVNHQANKRAPDAAVTNQVTAETVNQLPATFIPEDNDAGNVHKKCLISSQAGGFIRSQADVQDSSISRNPVLQETNILTQTQAGHKMELNTDALDGDEPVTAFKPIMSSTQMFVKESSEEIPKEKQTPFIALSKINESDHDTENHDKVETVEPQRASNMNDDQPTECHISASRLENQPFVFKQTSLRSDSPTLFDSDDDVQQKRDCQQEKDEPEEVDTTVKRPQNENNDKNSDRQTNGFSVLEHCHEVVTHRPIFKRRPDHNPSEGTPRHSAIRKSRLSLHKLENSPENPASVNKINTSEIITKQFNVLHGGSKSTENLGTLQPPCDEETTSLYDEDTGALNIKRMLRSKRMRTSHANVRMTRRKGVSFDEDSDTEVSQNCLVNEITFSCPHCGTKLSTFTDYRKESYRPAFVKMMKKRLSHGLPVGDLVTVVKEQLPDSGLCVITSPDHQLNSHWSREDDCVVQLLSCQKCSDSEKSSEASSAPCLGVIVVLTGRHNPRLKVDQVWLLPYCFKT